MERRFIILALQNRNFRRMTDGLQAISGRGGGARTGGTGDKKNQFIAENLSKMNFNRPLPDELKCHLQRVDAAGFSLPRHRLEACATRIFKGNGGQCPPYMVRRTHLRRGLSKGRRLVPLRPACQSFANPKEQPRAAVLHQNGRTPGSPLRWRSRASRQISVPKLELGNEE